MLRIVCVSLLALNLSACVIQQEVNPYSYANTEEICIIEDDAVREGFIDQLKRSMRDRGIAFKVIDGDSTINSCPVTLTYLARWSWDLTIYMSLAELKIYRNGVLSGDALYDARRGSGRLKKFIDAEEKVDELVQELFQQ